MKDQKTKWAWPLHTFIDDMLDDISKVVGNEHLESRPKINTLESDTAYTIELATPGFQREELSIDLKGNKLTVEGKKAEKEEETEKKFKRREFYYTNFTKSFELPEGLDVNNIEASYENGILFINLPKVKEEDQVEKTIKID